MKRIAIYVISDGIGGAEQVVWQTLDSLREFDSLYLITNNEMLKYFKALLPAERILNIGNVYVHTQKRFRYIKYLLNNRFYSVKPAIIYARTNLIRQFCLKKEIGIIHAHLDYALISSIWVKRRIDIQLLYSVHGAFGLLADQKLSPDVQIKKINFEKIDLLIFVSQYLYQIYLKNNIYVKDYRIIYNGISFAAGKALNTENTYSNEFKILFVGGEKLVKGFDILIETVKRVVKHHKVKVFLLGSFLPNGKMIKLINENSLEQYFEVVGFVTPPSHLDYFRKANVLFMPSRSEAMPMAAIEAVYCDLPIIATNVGGLPEVICNEANGYLCDLDPIDFEKKIIMLIKNYQSFRRGTHMYNQNVKANFSIDNMKSKLINIYN